jgi:hypothetical protein
MIRVEKFQVKRTEVSYLSDPNPLYFLTDLGSYSTVLPGRGLVRERMLTGDATIMPERIQRTNNKGICHGTQGGSATVTTHQPKGSHKAPSQPSQRKRARTPSTSTFNSRKRGNPGPAVSGLVQHWCETVPMVHSSQRTKPSQAGPSQPTGKAGDYKDQANIYELEESDAEMDHAEEMLEEGHSFSDRDTSFEGINDDVEVVTPLQQQRAMLIRSNVSLVLFTLPNLRFTSLYYCSQPFPSKRMRYPITAPCVRLVNILMTIFQVQRE